MKRITVRRELKKRLAEAKCFIKHEPFYSDIHQVYGSFDEEQTNHAIKNMQTDIDQIEFLLFCLNNKEKIEIEFAWKLGGEKELILENNE